MSQERINALRAKAIDASTLTPDGMYTVPRSWGVYQIEPSTPTATRRYRFGNHPVREFELRREFGAAKVLAHFDSRAFAEEFAKLLNAGYSL